MDGGAYQRALRQAAFDDVLDGEFDGARQSQVVDQRRERHRGKHVEHLAGLTRSEK